MASYEDAAAIVDEYAKKAEQVREEAKIVPVTKPVCFWGKCVNMTIRLFIFFVD